MNTAKKKTHPTTPGQHSDGPTHSLVKGAIPVSHNRTWQDNAAEFAALDRGEGWQFAVLVACSVDPGRGSSTGSVRSDRYGRDGKTSANEFSGAANTSSTRVRRYFDAWQEAAIRGWVPDASTLTPADVRTVEVPEQPWRAKDGGVYDASKTGGQINNTEQIADKAKKDPEYAARVLGAIAKAAPEAARESFSESIKSDPKAAAAADQALEDRFEEQRKPRADKPKSDTNRDIQAEATYLIVKLRAAHRNMSEIAGLAQNIRGAGGDDLRDAVRHEVEFFRSVCDLLEVAANGGPLDSQLQDLLDSEAGK